MIVPCRDLAADNARRMPHPAHGDCPGAAPEGRVPTDAQALVMLRTATDDDALATLAALRADAETGRGCFRANHVNRLAFADARLAAVGNEVRQWRRMLGALGEMTRADVRRVIEGFEAAMDNATPAPVSLAPTPANPDLRARAIAAAHAEQATRVEEVVDAVLAELDLPVAPS